MVHKPPAVLAARWAVVVAAAVLLLAGCGQAATGDLNDNHGYHGAYLTQPYDVPSVQLTSNAGSPFDLATDKHLDLVFFGYTHCTTTCRLVMGTLTSAYLRVPEADRKSVRVVFVSTDPARDTPAVLTAYLTRYHPAFVGLTGRLPSIERLAGALHVFMAKGKQLPDGGYDVDHTSSAMAVAHGQARLVWTNGSSPTHIAEDVVRLMQKEDL